MARDQERMKPLDPARLAKIEGMHHDGRGLYLKANPPGAASWLLRYRLNKQSHTMGLGPFPEVGLKKARERALAARSLKADRIDPIALRRSERDAEAAEANALTFKVAAELFIASKQGGWRHKGKTADQWTAAFSMWVFPILGEMRVADIDVKAVMAVLEQPVAGEGGDARFWEARAETASRARSRIENVLDYAKAHGHRTGDNPAAWSTLKFSLPKRSDVRAVKNHVEMRYAAVPAYVAKLRTRDLSSARALEFTILTAARTTEVRGMTWAEVDLDAKVWTVPAGRMKGKKPHRVPLTDRAVKILTDIRPKKPEASDYVFPGIKPGRPMSENTMLYLLQETEGDVTVHGFRSSFADFAREQTNFARELAEAALAHTVGSAVERTYAKTDWFDKRRELMTTWTNYIDGRSGADIIPIRQGAA